MDRSGENASNLPKGKLDCVLGLEELLSIIHKQGTLRYLTLLQKGPNLNKRKGL